MNLSCTFFTEPTPWAFRSPNADLHLVLRRLGSRREVLLYRRRAEFTDNSQQNARDSGTGGRNTSQTAIFGNSRAGRCQGNSRHASAGWLVHRARTGTRRICLRENYDASKSLSDSRPIIKTARRRTYRDWEPPFVAYMIGSCALAKSRPKQKQSDDTNQPSGSSSGLCYDCSLQTKQESGQCLITFRARN